MSHAVFLVEVISSFNIHLRQVLIYLYSKVHPSTNMIIEYNFILQDFIASLLKKNKSSRLTAETVSTSITFFIVRLNFYFIFEISLKGTQA